MVEEKNENINLFEILGGGMITEEMVQVIKDKLLLSYDKEFEIKKIGRSYGNNYSGTITTICSPIDEYVPFSLILSADRVTIEEDYPVRKICTQLEKDLLNNIKKEEIEACIRIDTKKIYKLDKCITLEKFIELYNNLEFFVDIYIKGKYEKNKIKKAINDFSKANKIKFTGKISSLDEEYYDEFKKIVDELPGNEYHSYDTNKLIEEIMISEVMK